MLSGSRPINPTVGGTSAGDATAMSGCIAGTDAGNTRALRHVSARVAVLRVMAKPLGTQTDACCCVQLTALLLQCQLFASCASSSSAGRIADSWSGEMSIAKSCPPQIPPHGCPDEPIPPRRQRPSSRHTQLIRHCTYPKWVGRTLALLSKAASSSESQSSSSITGCYT